MQDIPVQLGDITNFSTAAAYTTSMPSGNSHNNVIVTQPGSSQHNMLPQNILLNGSSGNMEQMTQGTEFVTSASNAGASIPQGNMLQGAQCNLTTQSEPHGNVYVVQNTRMDPLLSSAGYVINRQTSETTNSVGS